MCAEALAMTFGLDRITWWLMARRGGGEAKLVRRCAVCAKSLCVTVDRKTGRVLSGGHYFGTIDLLALKKSRYLYTLGGRRVPNRQYDPSVRGKKLFEYWECGACFGGKKRRRAAKE